MKTLIRPLAVLVALTGFTDAGEAVRKIELPEEAELYKPSDLPGYAFANASCLTCHSVEYVKYQPPSSSRAYWQATVTKMQKAFGAPIPDAQVEPIVDYLAKTYGAEIKYQASAPPAPSPSSPNPNTR